MNQFWVLVRFDDEPGSGSYRAYVNADNSYEAIRMAEAIYGRMLISESANPV